MTEAAMCRVCLAVDIRMFRISDTHLQKVYESLCTTVGMETDDSRPMLACYICYAQLQNCYRLQRRCLQSQELYRRMLRNEKCLAEMHQELSPGLVVAAVVQLGLGGAREAAIVTVKQERGGGADTPPGDPRAGASGGPSGALQAHVKVEEQPTLEERLVRSVEGLEGPDRPFYFQCRACKRSFYSRARLNAHRCALGGERVLACSLCARTFKLRSRLLRHERRHATRAPHQCHACDRSFHRKYQLVYHARSHTGEKPYQCGVCDKRFITKGYLTKHVAVHGGARPHRCGECGKTFKGKSNLTAHVRRHTGEKPYQCSVCEKRFNYNGNLKKHLQIHSGERPHRCDACDKAFVNNSDLVKHRRTHTGTGEKPYRCDVCNETFNYNSNFLKHKRVSCKTGTIDLKPDQ